VLVGLPTFQRLIRGGPVGLATRDYGLYDLR